MSEGSTLTLHDLVVDHVYTLLAREGQPASGTDAEWKRDCQRLLGISVEFLSRVRGLDDAALSSPVTWYQERHTQPLAMRVVRTTTHDAYHAGQIQYLRALQDVARRPGE